jgi:hypothetical protein
MMRHRSGEDSMLLRIVGVAGLLLAGMAVSLAATKLGPKDIQAAFFTGQPFTASTPSKIKFQMVFLPGGKVTREPAGKAGVKGQGTWKLTDDGFCTTWSGGKPNCYTVMASGDNKWSVMKGPTLLAVWSK